MDNNLKLLQSRHSVRNYLKESLSPQIINRLKAVVTMINTHEYGLKFQLFFNDDNPFNGFMKSYGTFLNPMNYLAAVVDTGVSDILEKAGYYGEKFVVEAVKAGLGTCFVGGTYDKSSVNAQIRAGEKILFLILFGLPMEKERFAEKMLVRLVHLKKMDTKDFFVPSSDYEYALSKFPELSEGLAGIACAPSSLNKRPVRVFIGNRDGEECLCGKVDDSNKKNLIDLGIAKFNFNYATSTQCIWGNGSPLTGGEDLS